MVLKSLHLQTFTEIGDSHSKVGIIMGCSHSNEDAFQSCNSSCSNWKIRRINKHLGFPESASGFTPPSSIPSFLLNPQFLFTPSPSGFLFLSFPSLFFLLFTPLLQFFCQMRRKKLCLALPSVVAILEWCSPPPPPHTHFIKVTST